MLVAAAVQAASSQSPGGAQSVYSAFSLLARGKPTTATCRGYRITRVTYVGAATSPEPRLAGTASFRARIAVNPRTGYGVATGLLTISVRGTNRLRASFAGVVSDQEVANGIFSGSVYSPRARVLSNATLVFNESYTFAAVRMGVEAGKNSGVVYPTLDGCP